MNLIKFFWVLALLIVTQNVLAYGSSGSSSSSSRKICDKLEFTEFMPADKASVPPGSEFSVKVSLKINPDRINVTVKGEPVPVTVTPVNQGYQVKGNLPESLKDAYARIAVKAEGIDKCQGDAGWLVKITE